MNWAEAIIGRYGLHELWDLNDREKREIVEDFCKAHPEDLSEALAEMPGSDFALMAREPLLFGERAYACVWAYCERILEAGLEVYRE